MPSKVRLEKFWIKMMKNSKMSGENMPSEARPKKIEKKLNI